MWQLASAIGEIALRRRGPEALPDSTFLVGLLLGIFLILNLTMLLLNNSLTLLNLENIAAQIILVFAFVFAMLAFFKLERRYRQTMSAMLGINILILLVYFPFALVGLALNFDLADTPFFISLRLGLFFWSVLIEASIFARAISQPLLLGFMFEILYVLPMLTVGEYFATVAE